MGNWTTVNIIGTCPADELPKLHQFVNAYKDNDNWDMFHCLCNTGGLAGLGDWTGTTINAKGNLAERDYSYDSVAEELQKIGQMCPTADIKVHVGGDHETLTCIKTVHLQNGTVEIKEPEIHQLEDMSHEQFRANFFKAIMR